MGNVPGSNVLHVQLQQRQAKLVLHYQVASSRLKMTAFQPSAGTAHTWPRSLDSPSYL